MEGKFRGKGLITKCVRGESYLETTVTTQTVVSKGFVCRQKRNGKSLQKFTRKLRKQRSYGPQMPTKRKILSPKQEGTNKYPLRPNMWPLE